MRLNNIVKMYGDKKVINNLNLEIKEGEIVAIMGPSGCGKTTLLNILAGLTKFDSGSIENQMICNSMVFQENRLCELSTAIENVLLASRSDKTDDAFELLKELGLSDVADKQVVNLSGGMKRRIAIARAVISDSKLILLDEPFTGLDESNKKKVMECVKNRVQGKTVVFVTHDIKEAEFMTDKVLCLNYN